MTIKELLGVDVDTLEKMSDEELRAHCHPYLVVAELDPEVVEVSGDGTIELMKQTKTKTKKPKKPSGLSEIAAIMAAAGVAMPESLKPK